jgi:serine/threonine-protein kinase
MRDCPAPERLGRFLREELGDEERWHIEMHVEECAACQETLHHLAVDTPGPAPPRLRAALSEMIPAEAATEAEGFIERLRQQASTPGPDGRPRAVADHGETSERAEVMGYEILGELGRGGVGVVYRARHRSLDRVVALKMILSGPHLSPEVRRRFRLEARAIARLRHPNIVQVYDVGEHAGCPYLSLERVDGGDLARWIGGVPRPAGAAAPIVATLASAVEYAHRQGVIHRDLKPANVLMAGDGTVKITDFGLAKLLPGSGAIAERMTQSGMILGTPAYIAPEQARGLGGDVGPAADVYSLGAILYELLTGRPPFEGDSLMGTLLQAAHDDPIPASRRVASVPRDLDTICLKCLLKDPADRYATAGELAADLERFLNHEAIHSRPLSRLERGLRWGRRRPGRAAALAGVLASVVASAGVGLWMARQRAAAESLIAGELKEVPRLVGRFSWAEAVARVGRAREEIGYDAPADLRRRLDQAGRDIDLAERLVAIRLKRATAVEGWYDLAAERRSRRARADREYEKAFRDSGWESIGHDAGPVASRMDASPARGALLAALDDWAVCAVDMSRWTWLLEAARRADPDAWRDRVREPAAWDDPARLAELARTAPVAEQPASVLVALGERWQAAGGEATDFLSRVQRAHPDDFWASLALGKALEEKGKLEEGISYDRKALDLRPKTVAAYLNIGHARFLQNLLKDPDGAIENDQAALQLDPKSAAAHSNIGSAWKHYGRHDLASQEFSEALQLDPDLAPAHCNLGEVQAAGMALNEAIGHYGEALRLEPDLARSHYSLSVALLSKGRFDETYEIHQRALRDDPGNKGAHDRIFGLASNDALRHYHQAIGFHPAWSPAWSDFGGTGRARSRLDEAIDRYRVALRINPAMFEAHRSLSQALLARGQVNEALAASQNALGLLSRDHYDRPAVDWEVQRCERLLALEGRLPAVLGGKDRAADAAEGLDFADLCRIKRRYTAAARFYADVLAARPRLADDQMERVRQYAPTVAILAASGRGEDAGKLSEAERARWRKQARDWMRADLAAWAEGRVGGSAMDRDLVERALVHWRADPDMTVMCDPAALAELPPAERQEWVSLWSEIDSLIDRLKDLK